MLPGSGRRGFCPTGWTQMNLMLTSELCQRNGDEMGREAESFHGHKLLCPDLSHTLQVAKNP